MLKFKNYKILLLLMLFAFAGKDTWATGTKYYSYHIIDVKPSGAGKVYSTTKTENGANTNFNACVDPPYTQNWHTGNSTNTLYLLAKANDGYVFSHWEDQDGTLVASSNPGQVTAQCAQTSTTSPGDYNGTYYAVFVPTQAVEVYTENANFGTASISDSQNEIGQTITLTAHENLFQHAFVGWRKESNGQIVSNDNPYTFTITEQTRGKYYAVFRDDYSFYRIKNYETGRYMVATNDQGGITNLSSFSLISGIDNVIYDAGSIVQVRIHYAETTAHTREYAIIVQGEDTQEITGAYLRMDRVEANELTLWEPNADGIRAKDNGGENVSLGFYSSADNTKWFFEKLDLDLEGENYFSLDPNKLVEVDGKYYTTLRTSWNILFNPEQMTPYIVKSVDETAGTFEMEAITGNIIPAGTPVIIETNSNDIEENRMVPTLTKAASGAVPSGNLLQASTKYFPNQAAPVSNCKGLIKNANGQLAFGGSTLSTVNGNEAYLSVANEVVLPIDTVTLAQLCDDGVEGRPYCIKDSLLIVYSKDNIIWVKDNNKSICKDIYNDEQLYLIGRETGSEMQPNQVPQNEYDQSNWLEVQLTGTDNYDVTQSIGYYVNANAIKGTFSNKLSPTMTGVKLQLADIIDADEAVNYNANYYCPASFFGSQQGSVAGVQHSFFFVKPKPQELANVVWAMWNNTEQKMVLHGDKHGFQGKFRIDMELNNDPTFVPADNTAYNFLAIIRKQELRDIGYMVYPLNISSSVITAVTDIAAKQVVGVTYYNVTGLSSERPFEGVNIVVTRYSDGSTSAAKRIF